MSLLEKLALQINGEVFYLPLLKQSPQAGHQSRLKFRNTLNLYNRRCALTGAEIITNISNPSYQVYSNEAWWSDRWNAFKFGRAFDYNRSFFEQFQELSQAVPKSALGVTNCQNCDYNNYLIDSKNCYLSFTSANCAGSFYTSESIQVYNSAFIHWSDTIENSAYLNRCRNLQNSFECQDCANSHNLHFCRDCINCHDCLGCSNLFNREYCIFNVQYTAAEYQEYIAKFQRNSFKHWENLKNTALNFWQTQATDLQKTDDVENVEGNFIFRSKNCQNCYFVTEAQSVANLFACSQMSFSSDCDYTYNCSYGAYQTISSSVLNNSAFIIDSTACTNCYYLTGCRNLENCFACVGLTNQRYCILNQQYSESECFINLARIIKHLQKTNEWGQFFPENISVYTTNESDYGLFYENNQTITNPTTAISIPDSSQQLPVNFSEQILTCSKTGRAYRFGPAELQIIQKLQIPLPRRSFYAYYQETLQQNLPFQATNYSCSVCQTQFKVSVTPKDIGRPYCHNCYLKEFCA